MKSKITLLIISSFVGLVALSVVQMYLINNTYELKKDVFIEKTKESIYSIDDHLSKIDSMRSSWRDYLIEVTAEYKENKIERGEILELFQKKTSEINPSFIRIMREKLDERGVPSNLECQKRVRSIVILDSLKNDTLYLLSGNSETYILGNDFEGEEHKLGKSTSYSEYTFNTLRDGEEVSEMLRLNFETETIMNIEGWERKVLLQMKGLLIVSTAIFVFVFVVLFYSIKTLITQKKIADIKTDFINNISHEFKTPLTTLSLATKMLKNESGKPENPPETIAIIDRQNKKLQKLLDQILDNSLGYSEIQLNKEEVLVQQFLSTLLDDFTLARQEENIEVIRDFNLGQQLVSIDLFYLSTALTNMLENAVKYNQGAVKLLLKATVNGSFSITIEDNGIGISDKDEKRLFEKFYRVGNNETHEVKGLGLGLYYANQIVKAHGGKIHVESKVGEGSTFTVELPLT